ncbi:MAG: molybdopterin molybdotransferase MoeA, partial [Halobacteriota archaeon]
MNNDYDDLLWRSAAVEHADSLRQTMLSSHRTETVPLDEIGGRTVSDPIVASADMPPHSHATMDGFAFDATDEYPLTLRDDQVFPESEPPSLEPGEAMRIATGAPLPGGANAVLKREDADVDDGLLRGTSITPGTYTYERGSNVAEGETLFSTGDRLSPKDALLLGDLGYESVSVFERFDVALLATGTEIHEGRNRDLDSPMLGGLIRSWGHDATYEGTVPDDYDTVVDRIDELAAEYDVVVTTGGTSVGKKDYVIRALSDLGDVLFHRVRIRPGKPLAAATLPDHDAVAFAVPGKPVGALTIATLVVRLFFVGDDRLPAL